MKKYTSKYKAVFVLQEKVIKEVEKEIMELNAKKNEVVKKIKNGEKKTKEISDALIKGTLTNSAFLFNSGEKEDREENIQILGILNNILKEKISEYQKLLKKRELLLEMDKRAELDFNKKRMKKEEKKISEYKMMMNAEGEV